MNTAEQLYWITRLDSIQCAAVVLGVLSVVMFLAGLMGISMNWEEVDRDGKPLKALRTPKRLAVCSLSAIVLMISVVVFVPSTKDAYVIYGLGNTIEYLKQNDTAQQLPDKALKAIDAWLDDLAEKETSSTKGFSRTKK